MGVVLLIRKINLLVIAVFFALFMLVVYGTEEPNNSSNQTIENNSSLIVNESEETIINETYDLNISENMMLNESMVNISEGSNNEEIVNTTNYKNNYDNITNDTVVFDGTVEVDNASNNTTNSISFDNESNINTTSYNTTNNTIVLENTLKINDMGNNTNNSALDNEPDMNIAASDEEIIIEEQINETSHSNANNEIPAQAESEKKVVRAHFTVSLQIVE